MSRTINHLGLRVAALRKQFNLTQSALAEKAGLSKDFISKLERGTTGVSVDNLEKVAEAMSVPVRELFPPDESQAALGELKEVVVKMKGPDGLVKEYRLVPKQED